jgi:hemerythrin-like domain-containing protein
MKDCHRRIEQFLQVLLKVVGDTNGGELDRVYRGALETALKYFRSAAPRHTADEEESLFPRMRRSDTPAARTAFAKLDTLEADHRLAEQHHDCVDQIGRRWLAEKQLDADTVQELRKLLLELVESYQRHIRVEEEEVFPLAADLLTSEDLRQVGSEMSQRREQK